MSAEKKTIYEYLSQKPLEQVLFRTDRGEALTCGKVKGQVERLSARLTELGIGRGKTIALRFPRAPQAVVYYFALLTVGAETFLVDPHTTVLDFFNSSEFEGMDGYLTDEGGTWILVSPTGRDERVGESERLFVLPPQDADAPAILIATSGSTGDKKLVRLSQFNVAANLIDAAYFGDYRAGDLALGILPLFHIFGQVLLFGSLILDYAILFPKEVSPLSALRCVETYGVNRMNGVPSLYLAMAERAEEFDVSTLRVGFIGGSPCSMEEIATIEERLGMTVLNAYGMSECVSISISDAKDSREQRIGGVGRCYPMSEIRIVRADGTVAPQGEAGEITVNGASRMLGYYRDEVATRAAIDAEGFLHTGDLGYVDGDGILHITGRIKEIIIRNGVNISASHVEEVLRAVPGVGRAAVVGTPDPKQGEVPVAVVESERSAKDILGSLAEKLPKNELPVKLYPVKALPTTSTGKVDKQAMKRLVAMWGQN